PSSSGLGHRPFTPVTRVRVPLGSLSPSLLSLRESASSHAEVSPAPWEPAVQPYDAILIVSFGGPEGPDEVMPFLENVLRGKNVPRERMLQVAEHYQRFGGVSPINSHCRALITGLLNELNEHGPHM